jgi:hypothetical protein
MPRGGRLARFVRRLVAVRYLRDLAATWHKAEGGWGRRMVAEALFERIDARGFREATLRLTDTAIAHGFAAVIPERLELTVGYGRGERSQPDTIRVKVRGSGGQAQKQVG